MKEQRVVVTGMGVVSPVGNDVATFWKNLKDGVCGINTIENFDTSMLPVHIAGQVKDFDPLQMGMDKAFVRKQGMFTQYAVAAAYQAMQDAGLKSDGEDANIDPYRLGVYVGSGIGGFEIQYRETQKIIEDPSGQWISPMFIPSMISNIAAGHIAIKHNAKGVCINVVTACATSSHNLGEAYRALKYGYADAIISGGGEAAIIPLGIAGFANAKALSRSEDPNYASLPFNLNRGGFVMGEGGAILVLETLEHAKARGAKIYAEMVGYGNTCDAYHSTAPRPDGTTQSMAMKLCLEEAGYTSDDVLYINAHGTGTHLNDAGETAAYKLALGQDAYKAHITSIKSMTGHMLGAAGAAEAIATVLSLREGIVTPTINLDTPDPECDLNYTPNKAEKVQCTLGISDNLGFGGHNACIAFRSYSE